MAEFTISSIETKAPDWKVASIRNSEGTLMDNVSINAKDKTGLAFPNFDTLKEGDVITADYWKSGAGKSYLFPPKPQTEKPQRSAGAMTKVMEKKEAGIAKAQDNKSLGIKVASTMSLAVSLTVAMLKDQPMLDEGVTRKMVTDWRKWLWENWDKEETDYPPFPSR